MFIISQSIPQYLNHCRVKVFECGPSNQALQTSTSEESQIKQLFVQLISGKKKGLVIFGVGITGGG